MGRLAGLQGETFDVAIIGGGIVGCGIARDAAMRGLRVMLVERGDFGGGTTAASTRIVHGGLRYLEMLDLRLVRLDLRERETLLRISPHLVKPLEFLIPFFRRDRTSPLKMRAGLALYDALSYDKGLPPRRWLAPEQGRTVEPALNRPDLRGVAAYHDARIDSPERLALENVIDASGHHATAINYCEAVSLVTANGRVSGVRLRDRLNDDDAAIQARVVVNATGAWFDRVTHALTSRSSAAIRMTKGIHIVCQPVTSHALVLFSKVDGRLMFAIPRGGLTWIGTTDTDFEGDPADARATRQDVEYVLASVGDVFPSLRQEDVLYTTAGVRALVRRGGSASSVSRMHRIVPGEPVAPAGVISVLGGKITGYRAIAEEATDAVCRQLGTADCSSRTAETPLPGARDQFGGPREDDGRDGVTSHLYDLYGTRAEHVLALARSDARLATPLSAAYPDIGAQVIYSVRHEHCLQLSDFLRRRSLLGASADQGLDAAQPAAQLMGAELGWTNTDTAAQVERYRQEVATTQMFRQDP